MKTMTVSEVSRKFDVSTRMLRYYEQEGLICSLRKEGYAYRVYDEEAVKRIQLILSMRKLRVSLKQIAAMLNQEKDTEMLCMLQKNVTALGEEITTLKQIRDIILKLVDKMQREEGYSVLEDEEILTRLESLTQVRFRVDDTLKERAKNPLVADLEVRFVMLPECYVAAYEAIGKNPEEEAGAVMDSFIRESKLFEAKPDARLFGFETVRDMALDGEHGYENWVTIPEAFEVTAPLIKKQFLGGLYAVHTIDFPNFNEWERLKQWVEKHEIYAPNYCEEGNLEMKGCLEEYLNWVYSCHMGWPKNGIDGKVDLYLPIKER